MKNNWNDLIAKPLTNMKDIVDKSRFISNTLYYNDIMFLINNTKYTFNKVISDLKDCDIDVILTHEQYKELKLNK